MEREKHTRLSSSTMMSYEDRTHPPSSSASMRLDSMTFPPFSPAATVTNPLSTHSFSQSTTNGFVPNTPQSSLAMAHLQHAVQVGGISGTVGSTGGGGWLDPPVIPEPTLIVPPLPTLPSVAPPAPPRRPPPPGYDMKTLRRQLDFLSTELSDRITAQQATASQNEALWQYATSLLEANQHNALTMRAHVGRLTSELRGVYRERAELAERLARAAHATELVSHLEADLAAVRLTAEELRQCKEAAESEATIAVNERIELEGTLRTRLAMASESEMDLTQYRNQAIEEQALRAAEDFYTSNSAILKSAYIRFKRGIQRRIREEKLKSICKQIYLTSLRRFAWNGWHEFLKRREVMNRNRQKRQRELLFLVLNRWKVFGAVERYCRGAFRQRWLRTCFIAWKKFHQEASMEKHAELQIEYFQSRQLLRKAFNGWRSTITFLGWNAVSIRQKEIECMKHFHHVLFSAWRRVAIVSRGVNFELAERVEENFVRYRWQAWHSLCTRRWRWRGVTVRKFFRLIRQSIRLRAECQMLSNRGSVHHMAYRRRVSFLNWLHITRSRRRYAASRASKQLARGAITTATAGGGGTSMRRSFIALPSADDFFEPLADTGDMGTGLTIMTSGLFSPFSPARTLSMIPSTTSILPNPVRRRLTHYHRRLLFRAFLHLTHRIATLRSQNVAHKLAIQNLFNESARSALMTWRSVTIVSAGYRRIVMQFRRRMILRRWQQAVAVIKTERLCKRFQERSLKHLCASQFSHWQSCLRRGRALRYTQSLVEEMSRRRHLARIWSTWQRHWTTTLRWKLRETRVEASRSSSLHELHLKALEDASREQALLSAQIATQQLLSAELEQRIVDARSEAEDLAKKLSTTEREKAEAIAEAEELQRRLAVLTVEKADWETLHHGLVAEQSVEIFRRQRQREDIEQRLSVLKNESTTLRSSLFSTSQELSSRHQNLLNTIATDEESLAKQREANVELQNALQSKRAALEGLEREQALLTAELGTVQSRVRNLAEESEAVRNESEKSMRERVSELRVLRTNASVAQARVGTLYKITSEMDAAQGRLQLQDIAENETREIADLQSAAAAFSSSSSTLLASSPLNDTLTTASAVKRPGRTPLLPSPSTPITTTKVKNSPKQTLGVSELSTNPVHSSSVSFSNSRFDLTPSHTVPPTSVAASRSTAPVEPLYPAGLSSLSAVEGSGDEDSVSVTDAEFLQAHDAIRSLTNRLKQTLANPPTGTVSIDSSL